MHKVKVKVLGVDPKGKIGLSIKQVQDARSEAQSSGDAQPPVGRPAPRAGFDNSRNFRKPSRFAPGPASFEDKLSKFLKDSDERLTDLRRKTDSKRGGRGSRRSG